MNVITRPEVRIGAPLSGEPHPVLQWIEVASYLMIPGFQIIGLAGPEVAEARERVRAAIGSSGLEFPRRRVVLNLSPASIRKRGTGADLAMALAVLHETYGEEKAGSRSVVAWGELGLDGALKGVGQVSRTLYAAWEAGADLLILSHEDYAQAHDRLGTLEQSGLMASHGKPAPKILAARNLLEAWQLFRRMPEQGISGFRPSEPPPVAAGSPLSFPVSHTSIHELMSLPRSLERLLGVAAAGAHHLILLGPRGTGKSHALEWLIALQPEPSAEVRVRRALLEELRGESMTSAHLTPVRRISSHARPSALIGSATSSGIRPGEFSLAHGGLLLADEFPEWSRDTRETLREPLERGRITLTRARSSIELPARFVLAANGNLCPCGGWPPNLSLPVEAQELKISLCSCPARARLQYLARLSGPILDRLDLIVITSHLSPPGAAASCTDRLAALRDQVQRARAKSVESWGVLPTYLSAAELEKILADNPSWRASLDASQFTSLRTRHKVLRVALSLAAWDGLSAPSLASFVEAACYRPERYGLVG